MLVLCAFSSIALIAMLSVYTKWASISANHFIRKYPPHIVVGTGFTDLKWAGFYFAGINDKQIYLGNHSASKIIVEADYIQGKIKIDTLITPEISKFYPDNYLMTDSNKLYLVDGIGGEILSGALSEQKLTEKNFIGHFTLAVPLSSNSSIFRYIDEKNENQIGKHHWSGQNETGHGLLRKQGEGLFSTDGEMVKVPNSNKIFYTYYYRNQFICADTNLNVLYRAKTIDTIAHAHVKVATIHSANQLTLAAPPLLVNRFTAANEKYLFIQSALKADNETESMYNGAADIDIYRVTDGKYQFSIEIPSEFDHQKLSGFRVSTNMLFALFGHYLYTYQLNFN